MSFVWTGGWFFLDGEWMLQGCMLEMLTSRMWRHGQCPSAVRMWNSSWGSSIIIENLFKEWLVAVQCFITWLDPVPSGSGQRIINRLLKTWSKSWPPCLCWIFPMPRIYSYWTRTPTILPCHRDRAKSSTARQGVSDFLCQQDIESWSEEILHNLKGVIEPSGVYLTLSTVPTLRKSHGTDRPCKLSLANAFQMLRWFDIMMVAGVGTVWFFHCEQGWKKAL